MITADQRQLIFDRVGDGAWRLCDTNVGEHHPDYVVAYVEHTRDGDFEAVWLSVRRSPSRHATKDDVMRTALVLRDPHPEPSSTKPVPIPHRPPPGRRDRR